MSQPVDVYPYPVIRSQPESSHSNGSYGLVFIVLAVILVITVVACVLGRLCNRQRHHDKEAHHHHLQPPKSNAVHDHDHELGPKDGREATDKPRIALKARAHVGFGTHGGGMAEPPQSSAGRKPEVRFADNV